MQAIQVLFGDVSHDSPASAVYPTDLLARLERLAEWLAAAGQPSERVTPGELSAARKLREAIYAAALDTIDGNTLHARHLTTTNRWGATEPANPSTSR